MKLIFRIHFRNQGNPDVKRSRPDGTRDLARAPVTALTLLKTVREARARHFPVMTGVAQAKASASVHHVH